ncbi:MAG: hypothetical protein ABI629_18895, partial [bacterium]
QAPAAVRARQHVEGKGAPAVFLGFLWRARVEDLLGASGATAPVRYASIAALTVFAVFNGYVARTQAIYREPALAEINAPLDEVLPGGALLKTNQRTHAFLTGLKHAVESVEATGKRYAIVPDVAGWGRAPRSPIPSPSTGRTRWRRRRQSCKRSSRSRSTSNVLSSSRWCRR